MLSFSLRTTLLLAFVLFLLSTNGAFAQSVDRQVITPFGGSGVVGSYYLGYTTGEPISATQSDPNGVRISGYQQPKQWLFIPVEENQESNFSVYPNPAHSFLTVSGASGHYDLLDGSGKLVQQGRLIGLHNQIDIESLPAGIYLIRLTNESGTDLSTIKILKF